MQTVFHFAPATGWLNDPNGLIEHAGRHHFFYQHNPRELAMVDMCWGHASSPNLLTWTEHPVALAPGPRGSYDGDGCWSGCAVDDGDSVVAVYSGNNGGIQLPCVARAVDDDLIVWEKSTTNPVIAHRPPLECMTDMRDHSVRRDGPLWRQVLAAGVDGEGMLVGYSSADLADWSWDGIVLRAGNTGIPGQIWECPDVFDLDGTAVAVMSVIDGDRHPGPVIWVTGRFDGPRLVAQQWGLLDHGDRLYAPQSYTDHTGRRIMFGWVVTQHDPAALGQQSIGVASLPRILSIVDGRLHQEPAAEIGHLRGDPVTVHGAGLELVAPATGTRAVEVHLTCPATTDLLGMSVRFQDSDGHAVTIDLAQFRATGQRVTGTTWTPDRYEPTTATLIFDSGIVETFLDDGRAAVTTDVSVTQVDQLTVHPTGNASVEVTVWPLSTPTGEAAAGPDRRDHIGADA